MTDKRLSLALDNLVSRGELSQEDAFKIEAEFTKTTSPEASRNKVLAEVGGYIGGLFIVVSVLIILGQSWHNISRFTLFSLILLMAIVQLMAVFVIGKSSGVRSRLGGLLGVTSAMCATLAIISLRLHDHAIPTLEISLGWLLTLGFYIRNKTIIGEFGLAGFSIAFGIAGIFFVTPHTRNNSYLSALVLFIVGSLWLVLANKKFFNRMIGDLLAMAMLFLSGQFMFTGNYRFITYLIYIALLVVALLLYSRSPEWPLLVGAIAAITVGTGEFVGETLGGSLGATLGLLTSGIFFVSGSVYSFKRSKHPNNTVI